jgi:hypothetical protein
VEKFNHLKFRVGLSSTDGRCWSFRMLPLSERAWLVFKQRSAHHWELCNNDTGRTLRICVTTCCCKFLPDEHGIVTLNSSAATDVGNGKMLLLGRIVAEFNPLLTNNTLEFEEVWDVPAEALRERLRELFRTGD